MRTRHSRPAPILRPAFASFPFPPEVIVVAVRWYLRYKLSYRDVEELLAERGSRSTTSLSSGGCTLHPAAGRGRPALPACGRRPLASRRDLRKVAGDWRYVYRAIDQSGQVIDVFVFLRRDTPAARRFFHGRSAQPRSTPPRSSPTSQPIYPTVLEELVPAAWHHTDRYANNRIDADHGLSQGEAGTDAWAQAGPQRQGDHRRAWFVQNLREGTTSWPSRSRSTSGWPSRSTS